MTGDTDDIIALRAALAAAEARAEVAEARAASAEAQVAHLKHLIARMRQDRFGASSERGRRLLAQLELELEELETTLAEDAPENAADPAVRTTAPRSVKRHGKVTPSEGGQAAKNDPFLRNGFTMAFML
ncbi:transposase, partial [Komagataeibacter oboediens]